ncbi:MAG TPA: tRNA (adenosine(37)-N6)-dimethylallyltransferase MiaA [Candidatus Limnocylindria bacterium]|jgi:tRNA dimethylallyltransferase|nr:tRNA (adenosine(37)-N6)-dimethylallyltransferase MiaA [Candidatus Limnocylindria bacterium]
MSLVPVVLAGATASGKSAVAMELAQLVGGEIVSVDSMQVYRGLNIGTAKPTPEERAQVPHHLIDIAELDESFDAARFVALAGPISAEIQQRGRVPIFCGGTGMYYNAWLNGLGSAPPPDPVLRAELEATPLPALLDELARKDWTTFDEIDLQNPRRIVRAIEVIRITGKPFSQQRAAWPERAPALVGRSFGLLREREDLVRRIDRRVEAMFKAGLIEETKGLLERGLAKNRTAMQAIGYRQVVEYLQGERSRPDTVELIKVRTRQFAKRQLTWFRGQLDLDWIAVGEETAAETARRLASLLGQENAR